jgi:hypothetical protein
MAWPRTSPAPTVTADRRAVTTGRGGGRDGCRARDRAGAAARRPAPRRTPCRGCRRPAPSSTRPPDRQARRHRSSGGPRAVGRGAVGRSWRFSPRAQGWPVGLRPARRSVSFAVTVTHGAGRGDSGTAATVPQAAHFAQPLHHRRPAVHQGGDTRCTALGAACRPATPGPATPAPPTAAAPTEPGRARGRGGSGQHGRGRSRPGPARRPRPGRGLRARPASAVGGAPARGADRPAGCRGAQWADPRRGAPS